MFERSTNRDDFSMQVDSLYNLRNYGDVFGLVDQEKKIRELQEKQSSM